jgi:hypothetical protein
MNSNIIAIQDVGPEGIDMIVTMSDTKVLHKTAQLLDVRKLISPELKANISLFKDGLRVKGRVKAEVEQECGVTLELLMNKIDEKFDISFLPDAVEPDLGDKDLDGEELLALLGDEDTPEPLVNGKIDLEALMIEFIALGIDPYPRKPGAEFKDPNAEVTISPFDALLKFKG